MKRVTPENITKVLINQRVLIGTNESGSHGAGIAKKAFDDWGLAWGQGFGPSGLCFGVPTKDFFIRQLPLKIIANYVDRYIDWCQMTSRTDHFVTKIGCGLAGYSVPDIAPMFKQCRRYENMWLPQDFLDFYDGKYDAEAAKKKEYMIPVATGQRKRVSHDTTDKDRDGNPIGF